MGWNSDNGPSIEDYLEAGWTIKDRGSDNERLVPPAGWTMSESTGQWSPLPPPPPPPAPTPWNTPGQALSLTPGDTKYDYAYVTNFGPDGIRQGFRMTYNGTPVVYVPADFVNRGLYDNNTREQYYSTAYLNKDIYNYLKPAKLDLSLVDSFAKTSDFLKKFDNRDQGYIIEESKFKELGGSKSVIKQVGWGVHAFGEYKWNAPIQGITEKDGKLVYAGLRGSPSASGEYTTYGEGSQTNHQAWHKSSGVLAGIGQSIAELGPATLLLNFAVPGLGTAIYAGTQVGQGIATGNIGQVARGAIALMLPVDGAPPVINIPGVSTLASTISTATGLSVATSGAMLQSAINYAATGGSIGNFLKGELASALGAEAGGFVDKLVGSAGFAGMNTIAKAVSSNATKAFLLNQDVSKAVTSAFADTAVPLALKNTPGWSSLSTQQQNAITNGAINTAKGGKTDIGAVIKNYTTDVFSDAALKAIPGSDKWTAAQTKLAKDTIAAGVQGKSLDGPLQSYMINQARTAVNDQVAKAEGWESDAQKQGAKGQYGSAIKPDDYTARQQGWEDLAEKQAAIKSYGDTITPVGVKEREQVKSIDPTFDATAYAKLNEVTGDPFQHFLTQGNKAKLPTNYESGADAALKSIGYKASADEVKQVADLFKKSADPDVALGKFYDEHWVTQEEAADAAKQAGFDLTPEQLKTFVGQASAGQNKILGNVEQTAKFKQETKTKVEQMSNNALAEVAAKLGVSVGTVSTALKSGLGSAAADTQLKKMTADSMAQKVEAFAKSDPRIFTDAQISGDLATSVNSLGLKDFTASVLKAGETALNALIPSAQGAGPDQLVLPRPEETTEPGQKDWRYFFDVMQKPDPKAAYSQLSADDKKAVDRATSQFNQLTAKRQSEFYQDYLSGAFDSSADTATEAWIDSGGLGGTPGGVETTPTIPGGTPTPTPGGIGTGIGIGIGIGTPTPTPGGTGTGTGTGGTGTGTGTGAGTGTGGTGTGTGTGTPPPPDGITKALEDLIFRDKTQAQLAGLQKQSAQAQQQANMGTLFGLLGGFGGQQAPTPAPQPTPLANIGYVYDIGGKSIFANPQQEKAFVSPYAEGGTVEDLMKILRG